MLPTQIIDNVVRVNTPAVYAFYIIKTSLHYRLALVCDDSDVLIGVIGSKEIDVPSLSLYNKTCGDICNKNYFHIDDLNDDDVYSCARHIFSEKELSTIPILNSDGVPIKMFGKFQAFFLNQSNFIEKPHYALGLLGAANLAKSRGYSHISAIEFGVASGVGLISLDIYANEVKRLTGVNIDVYGFDAGQGLLPPVDYRDCTQVWIEGDYAADVEILKNKLYSAQLVMGDICKTTKTFMNNYNPHPIGFIAVDVDMYTPTVAILEMLLEDDKYFLPTITMYFDDTSDRLQFQGESLAIREFNVRNEHIKISPERTSFENMFLHEMSDCNITKQRLRMKWCHRFNHLKFPTTRTDKHVQIIVHNNY